MQLQNSYIFLPNPYYKKPAQHEDKKGVIYVELGRTFPDYLSRALPGIKEERKDDLLFEYIYSLPVTNPVEITIIVKNVGGSYYVNVMVVGGTKVAIIRGLENIHNVLFDNDTTKQFVAISSYDAVSEYYCNKLYPKLNKLERHFRKLMFNIYVLEFGKDYFITTTTKEIQDEAKKKIKAKGNDENKEIQRIPLYLYSLEYSEIQKLLFEPRWTKMDDENKNAFLDTHRDLSKLSDAELRAAINDISPKSDWERFFTEKFQGINVEKDIELVRNIRNLVAHCKLLKKDEYDQCNKIINALNRALIRAITITEEKDFANKNAANLEKAMSGFSSRIHGAMERLLEVLNSSTPSFSVLSETSSRLAEVLKNITPTVFPRDYFTSLGKSLDIYSSIDKPLYDVKHGLYNPLSDALKFSCTSDYLPDRADGGRVADDMEDAEESEGDQSISTDVPEDA